MVNEWTRADLPRVADVRGPAETPSAAAAFYAVDEAFDAVVEHLNRRFPKVPPVLVMPDSERPESEVDRWRRAHEIVEQERDQAREQAAKMCRERDGWRESVESVERERDEYRDGMYAAQRHHEKVEEHLMGRAEVAERERDEWKARTAPTVTRKDVYNVLVSRIPGAYDEMHVSRVNGAVDAVCDLFGIETEQAADPLLDKAQEFAALADWELTDREAELLHTVAAHVLGQEEGDE